MLTILNWCNRFFEPFYPEEMGFRSSGDDLAIFNVRCDCLDRLCD
jgi:hypothetical protein